MRNTDSRTTCKYVGRRSKTPLTAAAMNSSNRLTGIHNPARTRSKNTTHPARSNANRKDHFEDHFNGPGR